ncbi:hypothetical protein RQP46_007596 [Phenoliferia psychrophenolica]
MSSGIVLERADSTPAASAHQILLQQKGAYHALEEAEKLAREEKPQLETVHRTKSKRSIASVALSSKRQDLEAGKSATSTRSNVYLIGRMVGLNSGRTWDYVLALIGSAIVGIVYPVFGISNFLLKAETTGFSD